MIQPATPENIALAAELLKKSKVVGMPTETVYGLAGSVFDEVALTRIFEAKERPTFDPLIVHVSGEPSLARLSDLELVDLSKLSVLAITRAEKLIQKFWPGPLTLVLPKKSTVPDLVTSGLPSVGVRMPRHPVARALIDAAGTPLAAPSANRFGRISPTTASAVESELGERISLILDGGPSDVGLESTVLLIEAGGDVKQLRPGGISLQEIESLLGITVTAILAGGPSASPGTLDSHYAPSKPFYLLKCTIAECTELDFEFQLPSEIGLLIMGGDPEDAAAKLKRLTGVKKVTARSLSLSGDIAEAGRNLFASLRFLDESGALIIFSEPCSATHGLGHAIADRLRRASHSPKD